MVCHDVLATKAVQSIEPGLGWEQSARFREHVLPGVEQRLSLRRKKKKKKVVKPIYKYLPR